ncbi:hypothetical protein F7Q99_28085 [Streptomyces kaniharaensis]|uniref:Uncharacterized protein n=1 Tax=Streptomyces kaniharaensis TaxID=212423 RepID=A0A6N7L2K0_9ACTN|nr:hypothetical protein [Streptomyces kaniharaensis]MQS16003.1 hypothetical protein [Streptomyces kaniharaensis]
MLHTEPAGRKAESPSERPTLLGIRAALPASPSRQQVPFQMRRAADVDGGAASGRVHEPDPAGQRVEQVQAPGTVGEQRLDRLLGVGLLGECTVSGTLPVSRHLFTSMTGTDWTPPPFAEVIPAVENLAPW